MFDPAKDTPCPDYIKTSNKYSSVSRRTLIERKNWQSILKNEAPDLVGIAFSKMPCIVFYFFPNGYHGQKKYQKKNPLKFVKFSLWVKPEAVGIAPVSPALASPCASPYYCASLIPLHQKSLGGTVKAIIHHPTDFAGVQWHILCKFVVLQFTRQKNLIYMCVYVCVYIYFVPLFICKFEPMTHASFEQVQRHQRVVFDPAKDTPSPESWKLP